MGHWRKSFATHMVLILVIKVIVLTALWHIFIKPNRVHVDPQSMAQRLTSTVSPAKEK